MRSGPPRPRFGLAVGVTGHRLEALGEDLRDAGHRIANALNWLESAALAVLAAERELFGDEPPIFTLVSPLASGADQITAAAALDRGWQLQAVLPFDRAAYAATMSAEEADQLGLLIDQSHCVLELHGDPDNAENAYAMAGRATVAHCDILLAVWDGLPARGRGGTAETVDMALVRGTPIIHLPIEKDAEPELLWSVFDPAVITCAGDRACARAADNAALTGVMRALLAPPAAPIELKFIRRFFSERLRSLSLRLEYPLLMTVAGARRLSARDVHQKPRTQESIREWDEYRAACVAHGVEAPLDRLQQAYDWSDRLATHFAQTYRSSHVFNFLLAALGAWIGLSGLVTTADPLILAVAEFTVVLAVVVNTLTGSRRCWHQRWLDYRQLAERLRPMRSLKLLGIAAPDPPGSPAEPVARRWIDWYAACVWRSMGCPAGQLRADDVPGLAQAIAERELQPQIAYNRRNAEQMDRLDGRLEKLALGLFGATMLVSLTVVVGLEFFPAQIKAASNWITALSAGLPALGTAIFGIRVHGDYGALAVRSRQTASLLEQIATDLGQTSDLLRVADLMEQAGRVMLADLGEWRLVNELHDLSLA